MKNESFFCKLTEMVFKYYFLKPTKEHFEKIAYYFSNQLVLIGTGIHEFYKSTDQMMDFFNDNLEQAIYNDFKIVDQWYECQRISSDVFLVYGGISVNQIDEKNDITLISMDTRFSIVYKLIEDTVKIEHIHHSIPYAKQNFGENYPKSLIEQAKEAMLLAKMFEEKCQLDLMTETYNNVSFKQHVTQQLLECETANMYLFDLDYFKAVNDNHGHAKGDELLIEFAEILKQNFANQTIVGRMGGDEFAVFEMEPLEKEFVILKIIKMQKEFKNKVLEILGEDMVSFSVGIVSYRKNQYLYQKLYKKADQALYRAKQMGRKTFFWD